jgi:hypothetical protein
MRWRMKSLWRKTIEKIIAPCGIESTWWGWDIINRAFLRGGEPPRGITKAKPSLISIFVYVDRIEDPTERN